MGWQARTTIGAALLATTAALPGLGEREVRVEVDLAAPPWSAVVRLQVPGVSRCTGVLVGPDTVVTAAHCVYGRRLGRFVPAGSVHVLTGYRSGAFTRHVVGASVRVADGYDPRSPDDRGADLAVVTLAQPVDAPVLRLIDGPVAPGTPLMLGGYGQDRAERILADTGCRALGYGAGRDGRAMLVHDCAGTRGTSGGPVLTRGPGGDWRLAGVQVAGNAGDAGGSAVPAAAIRALLPVP